MRVIKKTAFIFPVIIGLGLAGCVSPNIVLNPIVPTPGTAQVSGSLGSVQLIVDGTENIQQLSSYEGRSKKTHIGKSESLGVHLSDFWVVESPPLIIKRMLENNLKTWGYQVTTNTHPVQLHGHVNKYALNNKAINYFQFQADGVIDVDLLVVKNSIQTYKGHYVGTCTFKTASQAPNKDNMEKLFNSCVTEFQKRLDEDNLLRAALAFN
jgi:hypothetical protein